MTTMIVTIHALPETGGGVMDLLPCCGMLAAQLPPQDRMALPEAVRDGLIKVTCNAVAHPYGMCRCGAPRAAEIRGDAETHLVCPEDPTHSL